MASQNSVITRARRISLTQITSGGTKTLAPITHIALGDGGVDADGAILPPGEGQTALRHEIARYPVGEVEYPLDTTARYTIVVPETDLIGQAISEMALVDETGVLCAIRTTYPKVKDSDEEFTFLFDDEF